MPSATLNRIEKTINQLSYDEQLWLVEQLVHHLRQGTKKSREREQTTFESQLATMAADPDIQTELKKINQEFLATEADGLVG